jgi:hypothetical protein
MQVLVIRDGEVIDGIQAMAGDIEKHAEVGYVSAICLI